MFRKEIAELTDGEMENNPFCRVSAAMRVYDLSPSEKLVLGVIVGIAGPKYGYTCWASQSVLAKEAGVSLPTVKRAIKVLLARKLISYTRVHPAPPGSKTPPKTESRKLYPNFVQLQLQCDPEFAAMVVEECRRDTIHQGKVKAALSNRVRYREPVEQPPAQVWEEPAQQVEPVSDLPDLEETTSEQLPPLSLADTSKPVESVALVSGSQQDNGKSHPWFESEDLEDERARQLAALARYEESA